VTIDLESGYGETSEMVGETIALAIDAGAVGRNLEDSFPANGKLRDTADQAISSGALGGRPMQPISHSSSTLGPMFFSSDRLKSI
jgi:phosphoenolpyruvate phosphomutase-like protein